VANIGLFSITFQYLGLIPRLSRIGMHPANSIKAVTWRQGLWVIPVCRFQTTWNAVR